MKKTVRVSDKMQKRYSYKIEEPMGKNFAVGFSPDLTPKQMLAMGVFGGKYMTDCKKEFPKDWFAKAKLSPEKHDDSLNYFQKHASQPLKIWQRKEWIHPADPRGWFQWYCRYFMGRRMQEEDDRQIKRWRAIKRHAAQIRKNCRKGDMTCRPRQRQVLLHWAYDSRKI